MPINPIHNKYPAEMTMVGRLLLDYGELEIALMNCVAAARRDLDPVLKTMFRLRGEQQRIEIADALGASLYRKRGLEAEFSATIDAVDFCRIIRNQYAHAYWHDYDGLCLVALEKLARENRTISNLDGLEFHYIDAALLEQQDRYYRYAADMITYTNYQGRLRVGEINETPIPDLPEVLEKPLRWLPRVAAL